MSLIEAIANVAVGYGIAVVTQVLIFPVFGLQTTLMQNLKMGAVFTVVSIARSFALRRLFEAIRVWRTRGAVRSLEDDSGDRRGEPGFYTATIRTGGRDRLLDEEAR
jgi:hypothetical protein